MFTYFSTYYTNNQLFIIDPASKTKVGGCVFGQQLNNLEHIHSWTDLIPP